MITILAIVIVLTVVRPVPRIVPIEIVPNAIVIVVAPVFAPVKTLFLAHENIGVTLQVFVQPRMLLQKRLQRGVILQELLIPDQGRIAAKLLGAFVMTVKEPVEGCKLFTPSAVSIDVAAFTFTRVFAAVKAFFPPHEVIGIFFYLLTNRGVILKKRSQLGMPFQILPVVDQLWLSAQVFRNFPVIVQEPIEPR